MSDTLRERLRRLPKAELHLHLEGTVTPELLWQLARRHDCKLGVASEADARRLYRVTDFDSFITLYKAISVHLADPADYREAVVAMARNLAAQGIVYAEVFLSIGILLWREVAVGDYFAAAAAGRCQAREETGVELAWIADGVRQFGAEHLERVLDEVERLASPSIIGIGLGGDERRAPAEMFAAGYERARRMGLRTTIHAGETMGADSVRAAAEVLGVERIGHGLRSFEDPSLVEALAASDTWLEVCPTSNQVTGCWPEVASHPVRGYYNGGICLTLGSDDPGIFGCDLLDEYQLLHDRLGFSEREIHKLLANSFRASFMEDAAKAGWLDRLTAAVSTFVV